jgi:polysaccharide deacetylase family protein (PEP-CTERM system associated)
MSLSSQKHVLAVVVEDYCHVGPASHVVSQNTWYRFESRVEANTLRTLDLLDAFGAKATFFVLGWIGEHQPQVVRAIVERGHEVASKGYLHRSIRDVTPDALREDARRSRLVLEDAAGVAVRGYRTPRGGFRRKDLWALDILAEEGFVFDASVRASGLISGRDDRLRSIHRHVCSNGTSIWEVPITSCRLGPLSLPIGGGNYVRQLPDGFVRRAVKASAQSAPLVFYFHIWELDPEQPRISGIPALERVRQYRNLQLMPDRIRCYLQDYRFGSIADHLALPPAPAVAPAPAAQPVAVARPAPAISAGPRLPVSVVIPCFNEEAVLGYLGNTLNRLSETLADRYALRYVFVDDGSSDRTWQRMQELFGGRGDCLLLRHSQNRGIAAAVMTGIRQSSTEIVCCIDADGTFDPHQLARMIPLLQPGVDLVTSTCFGENGRVENVPAWRLALSKGATALYRFVLHNQLSHYTSCFRVYRRSAVADLVPQNERYVGITEILALMDQRHSRIVEFPATLEVRVLGQSKMNIVRTIAGHLELICRLALRPRQRSLPTPGASAGTTA